MARPTQADLDEWLPTIAQYSGFGLTIALIFALILGHSEVSAGFIPAASLMLYKTVKRAASVPSKKEEED